MQSKLRVTTMRTAALATLSLAAASTQAQDMAVASADQSVEVTAHYINSLGSSDAASAGTITSQLITDRPLLRPGNLLEYVPGMVVTQHSGPGKANQYFLRGFNLDHGTDFTTYVDGIPMNLPTHAHGQGYMDVNSIIPELVKNIKFGKGPYYAEVGDFSAAGYSRMFSMDKLPKGIFKFTAGQYDYYRSLVANSNRIGSGNLLYAGEFNFYNGVWQQPEDSKKFNGMLRYTLDMENWGTSVFAKAYNNTWTATNQIPQTAVDDGTLGLYGTMDPTDGGDTNRFSLSSNLWNKGDNWKNDANIYALYYDVDLYSNFTGYLENPVLGDQIHQFEHRVQTGGNVEHTRYNKLFGFDMDNTIGLQFRYDDIMNLGLDHTFNRVYLNTVTHNDVSVATAGIYFKNQTYWLDKLRTITGVRGDYIHNDVTETDNTLHDPLVNAANSGDSHKARVSPKLSVILGPWYNTEYFVNAGYGYHSNDARGTVLHLNPVDGTPFVNGNPISPVSPLAWSRGAETGIRSNFIQGLNSTLAFWFLESSQELVFVGDAGTTEVNGKSHRYGVEFTNYYKPTDWLTLDADFAFTSAHFVTTPEGATNSYIPNSVGSVITTGATVVAPNGLFGTLRLRHFSNVPLDESGTFWAGSTSIVNLGAGYQHKIFKVELDVFNIFGSVANDIAYAYDNAYPAGAEPQYGIMKHPVEPRMVRGTITLNF
jgi:hypothetical protein